MKTKSVGKIILRVVLIVLAFLIVAAAITVPAVFYQRGNLKKNTLSDEFKTGISTADSALTEGADARIMSANLLVHYKSWGGTPAKPRAKMFIEILNAYQPDVAGLQEVSDEWFCCLGVNLPKGYKFIDPLSTGTLVRMTTMIYNSNTVNLVKSGQMKYSQGDNPRLRRVVWGVFERKSDGKRFIVTSTHLDLIREGKEEAEFAAMTTQADELVKLVSDLTAEYQCPAFSTGDFNAMENGSIHGEYDAPKIYEKLAGQLTDTKTIAEKKVYGDAENWEYPTYDHIFLKGTAQIKAFHILSSSYVTPLSDHYPIFADAKLG